MPIGVLFISHPFPCKVPPYRPKCQLNKDKHADEEDDESYKIAGTNLKGIIATPYLLSPIGILAY